MLDLTFRGVLTSLIRYSILLLEVVAALQQLGLQTTSILAAAGAVLVAVGLALQGTISNIAAGLMLLWLRPFRVGDSIETASVGATDAGFVLALNAWVDTGSFRQTASRLAERAATAIADL